MTRIATLLDLASQDFLNLYRRESSAQGKIKTISPTPFAARGTNKGIFSHPAFSNSCLCNSRSRLLLLTLAYPIFNHLRTILIFQIFL